MGGRAAGGAGMAGTGMAGTGTSGGGMGGMSGASSGGLSGNAGMAGTAAGGGGVAGGGMAGTGGTSGAGTGGAGMAGGGMAGGGIGGMAGGGMAGGGIGGMAGGGMAGSGGSGGSVPTNLLFSEYFEGNAATQQTAFEIYNAGMGPTDLTQCSLRVYVNGAVSFTTILLFTTLLPGEVYVACSSQFNASCDLTSTTLGSVNGNDAVSLVCSGVDQDIFGQVGNNPGTEWGTGTTGTADVDLRRNCNVLVGDRLGIDAFNPVFSWTGFPVNTSADLGTRFCP
jgi:hypothetical protein